MKKLWISVAIAVALGVLPSLVTAGPKWKVTDEHLNWRPDFAKSSLASSSHTYTGYYAYGFSIFADGADVSFTVNSTTRTLSNGDIHITTSNVITAPDGVSLNYDIPLIVKDLRIVTHSFDTSATYYLFLDLGAPKKY